MISFISVFLVVIGLITGSGTLNIETKGANGLKGGDGGNGGNGLNGEVRYTISTK